MSMYKKGRPSRQDPPKTAGKYQYRNKKTGEIEYIGETANLARRMKQHEVSDNSLSRKTHDAEWKVADGRSSSKTRRKHEQDSINKHNPKLNKRQGGGGRKAK